MFELGAFTLTFTEIVKGLVWKKIVDKESVKYLCWLTAAVLGACFNMINTSTYTVAAASYGATVGLGVSGAYEVIDSKIDKLKK